MRFVTLNGKCLCGSSQPIIFPKPGFLESTSSPMECKICKSKWVFKIRKKDITRNGKDNVDVTKKLLWQSPILFEILKEEADEKNKKSEN